MKTVDIVHIALFAALTAVLGLIPPIVIPFFPAVPITAQSMGVMLCGSILGAKKGSLSMLLFLVLVAFNMPLLSGGRGGLQVFYGPTAGYLFGFFIGSFVVGYLTDKARNNYNLVYSIMFNMIGGVVVVYALGIIGFVVVTKTDFITVLIGQIIFIPGAAIKVIIASLIAVNVRKHMKTKLATA